VSELASSPRTAYSCTTKLRKGPSSGVRAKSVELSIVPGGGAEVGAIAALKAKYPFYEGLELEPARPHQVLKQPSRGEHIAEALGAGWNALISQHR
jgi:hypothetical protein